MLLRIEKGVATLKTVRQILTKLKIESLHVPATLPLGLYVMEMKICVTKSCIVPYIGALFIIAI